MRLLEFQGRSLALLDLPDLYLQLALGFGTVLERTHFHEAWVSEVVGPVQLEEAQDLLVELVDLDCGVFWLQNEDERSDFLGREADRVLGVLFVQVGYLEHFRVLNLEVYLVRKDSVDTAVGDLDLQYESVIPQDDVLAHFKGKHRIEFVLLSGELSNLFAQEVDLGITLLLNLPLDLVPIIFLLASVDPIQLLVEVLRAVFKVTIEVVGLF